jgi:hypothetical protein
MSRKRAEVPSNVQTLPDIVEQAKDDANEVKALTFEQTLAKAKIEAITTFPGDLTYNVADKEAKDEKTGKPLVSAFRLPAKLVRELYEVQAVQSAVVNRWADLEPKLTEPRKGENGAELPSLFSAPECFESITSDSYHGLKAGLQKTNPRFIHAIKTIQEIGPKGANMTVAERAQFVAAKQMKVDAERDITRAIETMHRHWLNRQMPKEGEAGSTRKQKGIKLLVEVFMNTLTRRLSAKKASQEDKILAGQCRMVLLWVRMDPKAAEQAFLTWEKERTAKSQQAIKEAQEHAAKALGVPSDSLTA